MYRSRLGAGLGDAALGYVSSVSDDAGMAPYDIAGSEAHTLMLLRQGIISRDDARKILSALESLRGEDLVPDGAEDIHELIEARVVALAGMASGGRMHTARSRNDQVALDMRMRVRDDIITVSDLLLDAAEALVSVAGGHQRTAMPLYTHLQQAQAGLFSHYLLAHADALLRDYERMAGAYSRVNRSPLGAGPVGGTSLPIDREATARMLGFAGIVENSLDATGSRDFAAEYAAAAAILMTNLSRIAEDLVVWSTSEFAFVELADEFASPSSAMPQKKNPDVLELTRGRAAQSIGGLAGLLGTIKGLASGYGRDLQQAKPAVWAASESCIGALAVLRGVVLTMRVDKRRMKRAAESGGLTALDVAEGLVSEGVPFREAHGIAGALSGIAHRLGRPVQKLTEDEVAEALAGRADAAMVHRISSSATVSASLKKRASLGSSGYAEQKRMIADRGARISALRMEAAERQNAVRRAMEGLARDVRGVTG